ncbi:MAG: hypothetical protein JRI23_21175 [Deltaproteobacteria bacterium]|nr:hypothetical protein [Deltaproteobacteria bacterium]MBW2534447.1 hypothetical protein [Deltaproteobacteria bacterium]
MAPGSWAEFPSDAPRDGLPLFEYCENLHWDPASLRLFVMNSGHALPASLAIYDAVADHWSTEPTPREPQTTENRMGHAYDHQTGPPGEYWFLTYNDDPALGGGLFRYLTDSGQWETVETEGYDSTDVYANVMTYFPERDSMVLFDRSAHLRELPLDTLTWSDLGGVGGLGGVHVVGEYNPVHQELLFGGGNYPDTTAYYRMAPDGTLTDAADAPAILSSTRSKLSVDPVTGDYLLLSWDDGVALHALDPTEASWTTLDIADETIRSKLEDADPNTLAIASISTYGAVLVVGFPGPWWQTQPMMLLYKHAG